jgi:integrase
MPKLTHSLPKYRKHRASGQAVTTLGGKDFYLGPYGTRASKREYDRLVAEWLASDRSPAFGKPEASLTVVELAVAYMAYAKAYYGNQSNSDLTRIRLILQVTRRLYNKLPAADFGAAEFKAVRQCLIDAGNSRTYINAQMKLLVRVFRWAASEGKLTPTIPQMLALIPALRRGKCAARETTPVAPVADEVVAATLPHLPHVVADMVRLQQLTGMRPAELCMLRPVDIDRTKAEWEYRPAKHKTEHHGKQRVVFIGPKGQDVLLRYLVRDPESYCFCPADSEQKRRAEQHANRKTPLSCGNRPGTNRKRGKRLRKAGACYTTSSYRRAIHRACNKAFPWPKLAGRKLAALTDEERAELKQWQSAHRWSPNQLRHSAATNIRRQFGLEAAQVTLGHSQAAVTQVYAERDFAKAAEVARLIG